MHSHWSIQAKRLPLGSLFRWWRHRYRHKASKDQRAKNAEQIDKLERKYSFVGYASSNRIRASCFLQKRSKEETSLIANPSSSWPPHKPFQVFAKTRPYTDRCCPGKAGKALCDATAAYRNQYEGLKKYLEENRTGHAKQLSPPATWTYYPDPCSLSAPEKKLHPFASLIFLPTIKRRHDV